jgi:hypothetical protein
MRRDTRCRVTSTPQLADTSPVRALFSAVCNEQAQLAASISRWWCHEARLSRMGFGGLRSIQLSYGRVTYWSSTVLLQFLGSSSTDRRGKHHGFGAPFGSFRRTTTVVSSEVTRGGVFGPITVTSPRGCRFAMRRKSGLCRRPWVVSAFDSVTCQKQHRNGPASRPKVS